MDFTGKILIDLIQTIKFIVAFSYDIIGMKIIYIFVLLMQNFDMVMNI